jgi:hypothetical protein
MSPFAQLMRTWSNRPERTASIAASPISAARIHGR